MSDRRGIRTVCLVGDSFVLGTGDPSGGGWAQRLARCAPELTVHNLGVRRDTATDVAARWRDEVAARAGDPVDTFCLLSWGVNDADPRAAVSAPQTVATSARVLDGVLASGYRCAFVGPPPVPWPDHDRQVAVLDEALAGLCEDRGVGFLSLRECLPASYRDRLAERADSHPDSTGYDLLWSAIGPFWSREREAWQRDLDGL